MRRGVYNLQLQMLDPERTKKKKKKKKKNKNKKEGRARPVLQMLTGSAVKPSSGKQDKPKSDRRREAQIAENAFKSLQQTVWKADGEFGRLPSGVFDYLMDTVVLFAPDGHEAAQALELMLVCRAWHAQVKKNNILWIKAVVSQK
jgi:hypothetical protein